MSEEFVPPVPFKGKLTDERGIVTPVWAKWFQQIFYRVGGVDAQTNAQLSETADGLTEDIPDGSLQGRAVGSGQGPPVTLTPAQATSVLDEFVGDSGAGGLKGLVPAPESGSAALGFTLKADGAFSLPGHFIGFAALSSGVGSVAFFAADLPATNVVQFETVIKDTHAGYNSATGEYTVPEALAGKTVRFFACLLSATQDLETAGDAFGYYLVKNGVLEKYMHYEEIDDPNSLKNMGGNPVMTPPVTLGAAGSVYRLTSWCDDVATNKVVDDRGNGLNFFGMEYLGP